MKITEVFEPSAAGYEVLKNGLNGFNEYHTGPAFKEKVSSFVKDENQQSKTATDCRSRC